VSYEVVYNADENCVSARIEGVVDLDAAHEYAREIIKHLSAHRSTCLLNDMRQASIRLSTIDIYDLPAWIEEAAEEAGVSRACRRALVVSRDFDQYKFYETVSRNHGHLVEVFADAHTTGIFRDMAHAREWLGLKNDIPAKPSA
jgi:hypothetical protein